MKHAEWNREVMNHATIVYQRRHRKWALKRARGGLLLQNGIYVLSDLWEKRAHKAEAEVRRLRYELNYIIAKAPDILTCKDDKAKLVEALKEIIEDDSTSAHIQNKCYAAIEGVDHEV